MNKLKGLYVVGLFMIPGFDVEAQVSVFTDPDSDVIVFETYEATTTVEPHAPGYSVTFDDGWGGESTFIVSPGGYSTRTYEVDSDD